MPSVSATALPTVFATARPVEDPTVRPTVSATVCVAVCVLELDRPCVVPVDAVLEEKDPDEDELPVVFPLEYCSVACNPIPIGAMDSDADTPTC